MGKKIKKIIPYFFTLIILVGLFSPILQVHAQTPTPAPAATPAPTPAPAATPAPGPNFKDRIDTGCNGLFSWTFVGCLEKLFYYTYFQVPTFILWLSAQIFNVFISIGLSSEMTSTSTFLTNAWAVVRDLSNIFFILILLYIAIRLILGLGGSDVKKMIAYVIIMALLINFSMFFTKIVIDSSNILALVFYNKLEVSPRDYTASTPLGEKDLSGELYHAFKATDLLTDEFLTKLTKETGGKSLPFGLTLGIMIITGTIMLWAAYALFVSGFMFLGRLIELWVLIIFSPFAFMSFAVPQLSGIDYIGWQNWSKRLLETSFMAPIFMFFIYLIFLLLKANIFGAFISGEGFVSSILGVLIPALIIIALLLKAVHFAKKGGGQFGEMLLKGGTMAAGLAVGAASGGASMAIGGLASKAASLKGLQDKANATGFGGMAARMALSSAKYGSKASFDVRNTRLGGLAKAGGLNLGTAREGGYEKMRADQVKKRRERAQNLEVGEDEGLKQELNKVEQDLQTLRAVGSHEIAEIDKKIEGAIKANKAAQSTLNANPSDPTAQNKAITAANRVNDLRQQRGSIKNASGTPQNKADLQSDLTNRQSITQTARATGATPAEIAQFERDEESIRVALGVADAAHDLGIANGRGDKSINEYEDTLIPEARHDVEAESRTRKRAYAEREEKWNRFWTGGKFNKTDIGRRTVREAGHNIRMEAKIEESGKGGGH